MSEPILYGDSRLPDELDARVRSELDEGEQLLWVGQPRPDRFARMSLPLVLFGGLWTAFSLFWIAVASWIVLVKGAPGVQNAGGRIGGLFACFPFFGLPFVLIGLGMLSSPFLMRRRAKRTFYALTDRRAILWEAGSFGSVDVRSYRPAALKKMYRRDYEDGSGDLVFEESLLMRRTRSRGAPLSKQSHGFLGIDNVREIEQLLRKALIPSDEP